MEIAIAFVVGAVCGWLVARLTRKSGGRRRFRPNKRQREILASLPPDPVRPTIEELVAEEAAELGVDRIPGAEGVPLPIRLKVWRRDRERLDDCADGDLVFVVAPHADPAAAGENQVSLDCRPITPRS